MTTDTWIEGIIAVTSEKNPLADISTIVTIVASLFAIFAAVFGFVTYRRTVAANRETHMHSVLREYLNKRVDVAMTSPSTAALAATALRTVKLYTLDEMAAWLEGECRRLGLGIGELHRKDQARRWGRLPLMRSAWEAKRCELLAWLRTIESHLRRDPVETAEGLVSSRACYGSTLWSIANTTDVLKEQIAAVARTSTAPHPAAAAADPPPPRRPRA